MFEIQCGKKQQDDRVCMGHFWICDLSPLRLRLVTDSRAGYPRSPARRPPISVSIVDAVAMDVVGPI